MAKKSKNGKALKPGKAYQQSGRSSKDPSWMIAVSENDYLCGADGCIVFFNTAREAEKAYRARYPT
ncbi:hypothetical protein [Paucibacter soli]|uniref:hypothetical protein n=1 Tax=Paucibacter soli TaxID=3133433 RepID=UPI0030B0093A